MPSATPENLIHGGGTDPLKIFGIFTCDMAEPVVSDLQLVEPLLLDLHPPALRSIFSLTIMVFLVINSKAVHPAILAS